jgi:hypothetical protein
MWNSWASQQSSSWIGAPGISIQKLYARPSAKTRAGPRSESGTRPRGRLDSSANYVEAKIDFTNAILAAQRAGVAQ